MSPNPNETDYAELVARLSLPEKVRLLTGATTFTLAPEERVGLGELRMSDGPTGVRGLKFSGGRVVTLFPNATLLSGAWSEDTAYEVGELLAEEAMVQQLHLVLGPTINLHRSVLGGRLFEAYSEDPLLTGKLAAAYVRGLQAARVGACLKHLVANESETDRNTDELGASTRRRCASSTCCRSRSRSTRPTRGRSWPPTTTSTGSPPPSRTHVNNEVVKGEWGYDGLIMSDWFATKTTGAAANGGLDLVMPGPDGPLGRRAGRRGRSRRGRRGSRSTTTSPAAPAGRAGRRAGDRPRDCAGRPAPRPDSPIRQEQLTRLAAAGITVLTNDGVLPLDDAQSVALVGRHALETIGMGGGSAQVNPPLPGERGRRR